MEKPDRIRTHKEIADHLMEKIGELGKRIGRSSRSATELIAVDLLNRSFHRISGTSFGVIVVKRLKL